MLEDTMVVFHQLASEVPIKVQSVNSNEVVINLPLEGYKTIVTTPFYDINVLSPSKIKLIALSEDRFKLKIKTCEFKLITVVPSLVLEVFDPNGVMIIKIIAPPLVMSKSG